MTGLQDNLCILDVLIMLMMIDVWPYLKVKPSSKDRLSYNVCHRTIMHWRVVITCFPLIITIPDLVSVDWDLL